MKAKPDYKVGIWNAKSHRKIYELLLNRNPPPIVSRLQIVNWKMYWHFLWNDKKIKEKDKEFIFMQTHGKIPTKCKADTVSVRVLKENPLACLFCGMYLETPQHLFFDCPKLQGFRLQLRGYLQGNQNLNVRQYIERVRPNEIICFGFADQDIPEGEAKVLFRASVAFKIALWRHRLLLLEGVNPSHSPFLRFVSIFADLISPG